MFYSRWMKMYHKQSSFIGDRNKKQTTNCVQKHSLEAGSIRSASQSFSSKTQNPSWFLAGTWSCNKDGCNHGLQLQQKAHQKLDAGKKLVDVRLYKVAYRSSVWMCSSGSIDWHAHFELTYFEVTCHNLIEGLQCPEITGWKDCKDWSNFFFLLDVWQPGGFPALFCFDLFYFTSTTTILLPVAHTKLNRKALL